jgi:hypothetical protein
MNLIVTKVLSFNCDVCISWANPLKWKNRMIVCFISQLEAPRFSSCLTLCRLTLYELVIVMLIISLGNSQLQSINTIIGSTFWQITPRVAMYTDQYLSGTLIWIMIISLWMIQFLLPVLDTLVYKI